MNNQKMRLLSLVLAAAIALGSVTAFADGEPVTPETTETTEMETRETEGSWKDNTYTDAQGIIYQLNNDSITVTSTDGSFEGGEITIPAAIEKGGESYLVTSIGGYAFAGCSALDTLTFSGDVGSIGQFAFVGCSALDTLTFSGDVDSIEYSAFAGCDALSTVTFSGDVGSIEDGAFWNCTKLETIYVPASMTEDKIQEIQEALESSGLPLDQVQIVQPEKPVDPATGTPSAPATGTTSATGSTSPTVQQLEAAERPDPQDVEATERYNFWMGVKGDLRMTADGKTLRVHVPADYTNMPASVMEQIRLLEKDITIDLRWSGERLTITPATAQRKTALKAFWTFEQLCELYAQ